MAKSEFRFQFGRDISHSPMEAAESRAAAAEQELSLLRQVRRMFVMGIFCER